MRKPKGRDAVHKLIEDFVREAKSELDQRWASWKLDYSQIEVHEVVGALLARQVTLAIALAANPGFWNAPLASLVLRPMTEVYLNLAWILAAPLERSRMFIFHGLGQMKLRAEHEKASIQNVDAAEKQHAKEFIESIERWIDSQQYGFMTTVNLGNWAELNQRKMAEEVGMLDFYNQHYTPYSAGIHSMWHHVAIYNLKQCKNPLHRFHKVPEVPDLDADARLVLMAGKYLETTFALFDSKMGLKPSAPSAFKNLRTGIERLTE